jgi:hypothetical protein
VLCRRHRHQGAAIHLAAFSHPGACPVCTGGAILAQSAMAHQRYTARLYGDMPWHRLDTCMMLCLVGPAAVPSRGRCAAGGERHGCPAGVHVAHRARLPAHLCLAPARQGQRSRTLCQRQRQSQRQRRRPGCRRALSCRSNIVRHAFEHACWMAAAGGRQEQGVPHVKVGQEAARQ